MARKKDELAYAVASCTDTSVPWQELYQLYSTEELINMLAHVKGPVNHLPQVPAWLAKNVRHLKDNKFQALLNDKGYIYEPKFDGNRAKLHILEGGTIRIDSRNRSTVTYCYDEKTANFPHMNANYDLLRDLAGTVIDCEIMGTERLMYASGKSWVSAASRLFNSNPAQSLKLQNVYGIPSWKAFDLPFFRGEDMRHKTLEARKLKLLSIIDHPLTFELFNTLRIELVPYTFCTDTHTASHYFSQMLNLSHEGIEGMMFKHVDAHYPIKHGARTKDMFKWKKCDTLDCFVTGSIPGKGEFDGMVGSLIISAYTCDGNEVRVGAIQPGNLATRRRISNLDGSLVAARLNECVEIEFQEWTRNGQMRHANLLNWRYGKIPRDCVIEEGNEYYDHTG